MWGHMAGLEIVGAVCLGLRVHVGLTHHTEGEVCAEGTPDAPPALPVMDERWCSLSYAYPEINLVSLVELMSYPEKEIKSDFAKRQQAAQTVDHNV